MRDSKLQRTPRFKEPGAPGDSILRIECYMLGWPLGTIIMLVTGS